MRKAIAVLAIFGCGEATPTTVESVCSIDGLCTEEVISGLENIRGLDASEDYIVFESGGEIFLHSFADNETRVFLTQDKLVSKWFTPSVSEDLVVANGLTDEDTMYVCIYNIDDGEKLFGINHGIPLFSGRRQEIDKTTMRVRGGYLAYFIPDLKSRDKWELMFSRITYADARVDFSEASAGVGSHWSEFDLSSDGDFVFSLTRGTAPGKTNLDLYKLDFSVYPPETLYHERIFTADPYMFVGHPSIDGDRVAYEINAVGPFGAEVVTSIVMSVVGEDGLGLFALQYIPEQFQVYSKPSVKGDFVAWLNRDVDSDRPAIAIRKLTMNEQGGGESTESYGIFSETGRITEYSLLNGRVVWASEEPDGYALHVTELPVNATPPE